MMTVAELHTANRALEARKEAAEIKRNLAAVQMEAAEGAKRARQNRQQTLALKQGIRAQLQQQQIQALEATRASQKATAAAARRAALHNDTLVVSGSDVCLHQTACHVCHHPCFTNTSAPFSTRPIVAS